MRFAGSVRFTLTGEDGFSLCTHFGEGPVADEPQCEIAIDRDVYTQLRSGAIDAEEAFLRGRVEIAGDTTRDLDNRIIRVRATALSADGERLMARLA